ncbi:Cytochrome c556 [Lutimaribacter pacificus]|uniref:Cytochrome c556 n=1 Tax=Lutimaribacter pacificus TaxID=391948 RepID=A0A1H0A6U3_9RHOB|nr:cytochrome c [Lutimaribacter pacificus]SDN29349.1 Cytochrome c556 [Lutimaribacter pacificus]SHJ72544.1 Cytochrome c556 [Lutimaribacter pacificus]
MKQSFTILAGAVVAVAMAGTVIAQSDGDKAAEAAQDAREAQMDLYAFNLGLLGDMAKGAVPYDAAAAQAAAENLAALSALDQSRLWPEGSGEMSIETRAKVDIWDDMDDFTAKADDLMKAAAAMAEVAGTGLEAVQGQMGALGGACGACHKAYRAPES